MTDLVGSDRFRHQSAAGSVVALDGGQVVRI
jgi:hypothetical protein